MSLILPATAFAIGAFAAAAALAQFASLLLAILRVRAARSCLQATARTPISIIRPVCGLDYQIDETLESSFVLDYPEYEIVFCAETEGDAVLPLIRRLIAAHPEVDARLLVGNDRISINPKLNNVVKGYSAARHDLLMMVDSNVLMPPRSIQIALGDMSGSTGIVSAPGVGYVPKGIAAELECALLNTFQARWLLAADRLGAGYAQGKMMLFRRSDLERAGGIGMLAQEVAEDAALTKVMRRLGLAVRMSDCTFLHPLGHRRFAEIWRRQVRWAKLRRSSFPSLYALEFAANPLVVLGLLAGLALSGSISFGWLGACALALYGGEAALAVVAGWRLTPLSPIYWILRDLLMPAIWALGWARSRFEWRGHAMAIGEDGGLNGAADPGSDEAAQQGAGRPAK